MHHGLHLKPSVRGNYSQVDHGIMNRYSNLLLHRPYTQEAALPCFVNFIALPLSAELTM